MIVWGRDKGRGQTEKGEKKMDKIKKYKTVEDILTDIPKKDTIINSYLKCYSIINNGIYKNIMCYISGGKDSDIMLDMVYRCDQNNKVHYVFFDTGLEYTATKDHLYYLEHKYNIEIERERAYKPIVLSVKEFGLPFLSKRISTLISRLQKESFDFTDKTFKEHEKEYDHSRSALRWFDNDFGEGSRFNINKMKLLREYLIENKPDFLISDKCCDYSKKKTSKNYVLRNGIDLYITGVRKAEGGVRTTAYKTCYYEQSNMDEWTSLFMPLFWYKKEDISMYMSYFDVKNSDCYSVYGFPRTGCACCPFAGKRVFEELEATKKYEPKLYKAVKNVFGKSYDYMAKYYDYRTNVM